MARVAGPLGVALLLTGMGKDGAAGLAQVRAAGGYTLAQDEASSVVFGMPAEAIRLEAACEVAELGAMAASVCRRLAALG
nr:chemotaxis protein CheB [Chitinimonas koreensis]